ncbi:hypothetical protein [Novosphingobium terrae]|uniref:hypothetical protein n=1 Tax=Novosphingobium terrae TaxID=2726189 RepID=UPI0019814583|nr:hypothetical protein [Novosphingobium terrae]
MTVITMTVAVMTIGAITATTNGSIAIRTPTTINVIGIATVKTVAAGIVVGNSPRNQI